MIFRILEDQKDHSTNEIASLVSLPATQVSAFLKFLATYYIVTCDASKRTVILSPEFVSLR
jgi:DNA-binding IclR family transcriptional regulator